MRELLRAFELDEWDKVVDLVKLNMEHHPTESMDILRRNNKIEVWHDTTLCKCPDIQT